MGRKIAGIVVGYIGMFIIVFVGLTIAYMMLGADGAFKPGTYELAPMWIAIVLVVGILAAIIGGWLCALIARSLGAAQVLALVVVVLGLLMAIPAFTAEPVMEPRTADVSNMDAMMRAESPVWMAVLHPFLGAIGVLIGASIRKPRAAA